MKGAILLSVAVFTVLTVGAQPARRFSLSTDAGVGIALSEPASTPFLWRVTGYWSVGNRMAIGAGTGLSFYEKTLVPVFGDLKLSVTRPRRFTPYVRCGVGYAFAAERDVRGGLLLAPAVGVERVLRGSVRLYAAAGFEMQKMERLKTYAGPWFSAAFRERTNHRSLTISFGVRF